MPQANGKTPTETSPLLPKPSELVDPSAGNVPDSIDSSEGGLAGHGNGAAKKGAGASDLPAAAEDGEETLSRQDSATDRERHYAGDPEQRKRLYRTLPALAIGIFLAALDQTIIVSSYGRIGSDLDALQKTSWIATAYFLTLTSFQPLYGKLSDIFTRKSCLLFAYAFFGLGTLGCGVARNINELIAARAVAGIGGGGMTTVVSILLSDIIPLKERGSWQGYLNIVFATGAGVGAPLGGLFADMNGSISGWRWSFLFQAPLCLVAFLSVALVLKTPPRKALTTNADGEDGVVEEEDWRTKLKRIDFLGSFVIVCAVFSLLLGFDRGSNVRWGSVECLVPLCLSFPLFALFIYIEMRVSSEPIAPSRVMVDRSLFACFLCNFFSFAGYMATIFNIPLYYQAVKGYTAMRSGLLLLPGVVAGVSGSLFAGAYMQRFGRYYWLTVVCYANLTFGVFFILLFTGLVVHSDVGISIALVITGFSNGIGVTSTLIGLSMSSSPSLRTCQC